MLKAIPGVPFLMPLCFLLIDKSSNSSKYYFGLIEIVITLGTFMLSASNKPTCFFRFFYLEHQTDPKSHLINQVCLKFTCN